MSDEQRSSRSVIAEPAEEHDPPMEDEDVWQHDDELPRRPRRTLLTPLTMSLAAILLIACGFIAGVLVQKGQTSTGSTPGAARFAALRRGSSAAALPSGSSVGALPSATGGPAAAGPEGASSATGRATGSGVTVGQVAFAKGSTLYVTDTQGNTVKVKTSAASTVTKTVSSSVKAIHPGETVLVTGSTSTGGILNARSIRVGAASTGGLGGLLSGSASPTDSGSGPAAGTSGAGEPALFGRG